MAGIIEAPILKTRGEIEAMRRAGGLAGRALELAAGLAVPGATTAGMDRAVEAFIRDHGATPTFKGYPSGHMGVMPFPASICASVNEVVVHGIPNGRLLREGDILSVDVGVHLDGFCGDAARTFAIGSVSRKARKLIESTELALQKAVAAARPGGWLIDIARAVENTAAEAGFSVVRQFVGHGIGRRMHEPPQVPNYVEGLTDRASGERGLSGFRLDVGLVLAIEPMLNTGSSAVLVDRGDGWTVFTKDRGLSAHFEHTVAVTDTGPRVLTAAA